MSNKNPRVALGIDIGTTSASAAVIDIDKKCLVESFNVAGGHFVDSEVPGAKEQDVEEITAKLEELIEAALSRYPQISAIGFTGQMHGIVYCDKEGRAISNLATWQDGRADSELCDEIFRLTGYRVSPGYGLATHCYNAKHGLVPKNAASLCTVMDCVAMKICRLSRPIIHATNAHSLGLFDIENGDFDREAIRKLGLDADLLPKVTSENAIIGKFRDIPVAVAIGDNQASFLGAVKDEDGSVLANYGTGSQVSCVSDTPVRIGRMECRPYVDGKYLFCGSALCGGRAYAILESFFRDFMDGEDCYGRLNAIAERAFGKVDPLDVCTKFSGERGNPHVRGSVSGLSESNFTPSALVLGVLYGMARELEEMYSELGFKREKLVASGNAVRKNPAFRKVLAEVFGMEVSLTSGKEEAATGAAAFALLSSDAATLGEFKAIIQ